MTQNLREVWSELSTNPRLFVARVAIACALASLYWTWGHGAAIALTGLLLTMWTSRTMARKQSLTHVASSGDAGDK